MKMNNSKHLALSTVEMQVPRPFSALQSLVKKRVSLRAFLNPENLRKPISQLETRLPGKSREALPITSPEFPLSCCNDNRPRFNEYSASRRTAVARCLTYPNVNMCGIDLKLRTDLFSRYDNACSRLLGRSSLDHSRS